MPFKKLLEGYKVFHRNYFKSGSNLFQNLARDGQTPETLIISCSDSRADPAIVTQSAPGDMFVVRNVAAIVPPYKSDSLHHGTSAAIEFAVRTLKVKHIVVMGHSLCGGIHALANRDTIHEKYEFLRQWINIGAPALDRIENELKGADEDVKRQALEQAVVLVSLDNLMTFPWIADSVSDGSIKLHGWYFDLHSGKLLSYNADSGSFEDINTKGW